MAAFGGLTLEFQSCILIKKCELNIICIMGRTINMTVENFSNNLETNVFNGIIFLSCISEFTIRIYADINRRRSINKRKTSDSGSAIIVVIGLVGSIYISFLLSKNNMSWLISKLMLPHFFYYVGLLIMLGGLILRDISVLTLRRYFTVLVQITDEHKLIQNGVYKRLRNPSYTGMLLFTVGVAISLCNPISAILALIIFTSCISIRIRVEEKALEEKFGSQFKEYCAHTWRLIPFIC